MNGFGILSKKVQNDLTIVIYEGNFKDGLYDGIGVYNLNDDKYEGEFS
jgi:hypothetical protein